ALVERPPVQAKEGTVFVEGFDTKLDELQRLRHSGSERMTELEQELRLATQIPTLRVKFTRVFGWYVEVSRGHASKVPKEWRRKQTVACGERFTLDRLDDLSDDLMNADLKFRTRELELLDDLSACLSAAAPRVHKLTAQLSAIDVAASLAQV